MSSLVKAFKGFRFDPELYAEFKKLAIKRSLRITEALEKFMAACVTAGGIAFPEPVGQKGVVETEARVLLAWLRGGKFWYRLENGEEASIAGRLLGLLARVRDEEPHREIEEALKKIPR